MNERKRDQETDVERDLKPELKRWTSDRHEEIAAATSETTDEDRRRAVAAFTKLAKRPRESPGRSHRRAWLTAAAIAVAFVLGWFLRNLGTDAPIETHDPNWMGPGSNAEFWPMEEVTSYDRFRWTPSEAGFARYSLRVWNAGEQEPALSKDDLFEASYSPSADELGRLGPAIRWEVFRLDESGGRTLLGSASASLSSSR
jgi:hypothetical protein